MEPTLPEGVRRLAVRTPTLPPATHTNVWVLGDRALTVVDPASPWEDERARTHGWLRERLDTGATIRRLFLTHHHHDHVGGVEDLRARLAADGVRVPVAAHPVTAALVADRILVDETVVDGDVLEDGIVAVHTPGHAPGHLCLAGAGFVVAGDMVAGEGTIVIDPAEGDLQDYLDSLQRLRGLGRDLLLPAHGPALAHADTVLSHYAAHRHHRTSQIREALLRSSPATAADLAPMVYPELDPRFLPIAAVQITTHLRWLVRHGLARTGDDGRYAPS